MSYFLFDFFEGFSTSQESQQLHEQPHIHPLQTSEWIIRIIARIVIAIFEYCHAV